MSDFFCYFSSGQAIFFFNVLVGTIVRITHFSLISAGSAVGCEILFFNIVIQIIR